MTMRNEVAQCSSALIDSELYNSGIVIPLCRSNSYQVLFSSKTEAFSLSTCVFKSQLEWDSGSRDSEHAPVSEGRGVDLLSGLVLAFPKHLVC